MKSKKETAPSWLKPLEHGLYHPEESGILHNRVLMTHSDCDWYQTVDKCTLLMKRQTQLSAYSALDPALHLSLTDAKTSSASCTRRYQGWQSSTLCVCGLTVRSLLEWWLRNELPNFSIIKPQDINYSWHLHPKLSVWRKVVLCALFINLF